MKKLLIVLSVLALIACGATSGVKMSSEQTEQFVKGQTTMPQLVAALGRPNTVTTLSNGETLVQYTYVNSSVRGATFIPIVGLFAGGADVETEVNGFTFDKNGLLKEITKRTSTHGSSLSGGS